MAKIMNERIRKLAEQAMSDVREEAYPEERSWGMDDVMEKFAELIIEECAFQCQHLGDMERIGKHFEVDVFKQFGV